MMDGMLNAPIGAPAIPGISLPRAAMEVIVDDSELRITRLPGRSTRCVVSFSGVGLSTRTGGGDIQREEFGRSAAEASDSTLLFVIDKTRTWYNGVHERMLEILRTELHGYRDVVTLGNSMGGYAALRFAAALPRCRRAIAFSPQYAVHPEHMPSRERRWKHYRDGIADHKLGHALEARTRKADYWVFYGIEKLPDVTHFEAFRDLKLRNLQLLCLDHCGHDVAQRLQKARVLGTLLEHLLPPRLGARDKVDEILSGCGLPPLDAAAFRAKRIAQLERRASRIASVKAQRKAERIMQRKEVAASAEHTDAMESDAMKKPGSGMPEPGFTVT